MHSGQPGSPGVSVSGINMDSVFVGNLRYLKILLSQRHNDRRQRVRTSCAAHTLSSSLQGEVACCSPRRHPGRKARLERKQERRQERRQGSGFENLLLLRLRLRGRG
jgi:hypothetical protein